MTPKGKDCDDFKVTVVILGSFPDAMQPRSNCKLGDEVKLKYRAKFWLRELAILGTSIGEGVSLSFF